MAAAIPEGMRTRAHLSRMGAGAVTGRRKGPPSHLAVPLRLP